MRGHHKQQVRLREQRLQQQFQRRSCLHVHLHIYNILHRNLILLMENNRESTVTLNCINKYSLLHISLLCSEVVSALIRLVGCQEGHPACKKWCWFVAGMICLELCMSYSSSCDHHLHHP